MKRVCLFTAITYERGTAARAKITPLPAFNHYNWTCEAYLFTNDPSRVGKVEGWNIIKIDDAICKKYHTRKIARYIKTHSHCLLPECDVSVWIDANIILLPPFIAQVNSFDNSSFDLQSIIHPKRKYTYDEINICQSHKLDPNPINFTKQKNYYIKEHFPDHRGLLETRIVFRKTTKLIECFNELWWNQIDHFTVRDQCSVMFALWKLSIPFNAIPYSELKKCMKIVTPPAATTRRYGTVQKTIVRQYRRRYYNF